MQMAIWHPPARADAAVRPDAEIGIGLPDLQQGMQFG